MNRATVEDVILAFSKCESSYSKNLKSIKTDDKVATLYSFNKLLATNRNGRIYVNKLVVYLDRFTKRHYDLLTKACDVTMKDTYFY